MKAKLYEDFLNEAVQFGKKGILNKLEQKLEIAKQAIEKWGTKHYDGQLKRIEGYLKNPNSIKWDEHELVQGGEKQENYEVFDSRNAIALATQIKKVLKKYKKYEVAQSSTGAAAGWSGTMRSTVGGDIQPRANFNGGGRSYLIAVTIGGGIDGSVKDKLKQELYELFFVLDEYNGTDGGVFFNEESGTNYHTVGLACSKHQFNQAFAGKLIQIMNG